MRKLIIYLAVALCLFVSKNYAQENNQSFESRVKEIALAIEKITIEEKAKLKTEVEAINTDLEKGYISKEQSDEKKLQLATQSAKNIETRVAEEEAKLSALIKDKVEGKIQTIEKQDASINLINIKIREKHKDTIEKSEKRTTNQFVFAAGFNNLITNNAISNSDYGYLRSVFAEWGFTWNTRVIPDDNLLHIKYGFTFVYNSLYPTNNRVFQVNGNKTELVEFPETLKKSETYFKNVFLTLPLHFELDFSKNKMVNNKPFYRSHNGFRLGLGGFVGYNTNSKQFLAYESNGYKFNEVQKGNWNVADWNYGLSAYFGHKATSVYVKYDLNTIFENNDVKQNNVSLGIRFDLN
jgi:hypothetical protein